MSKISNLIVVILLVIGSQEAFSQSPESRIADLGIELPQTTAPLANYVKWKKVGNVLYLSGHVSETKGKLGDDLTTEEGYEAGKETGISILATLKMALGELDDVKQIISASGMVNSTPDYYDQSKVINGFSDLMVSVFGEPGKHTRTAVGQSALPGNYAVEIAVVVEIKSE